MANSLIYIPDISGFTAFVNATEINHAQHIISELLEIIIDSNRLDLQVAEIEGDAVLFYKHDHVPAIYDLLTQSEETFIKFHEHLKRYEVERVCNCGACSSASNLGLKIIAHGGEIGFTKVKDSVKPFGPTLVSAHRLLKNELNLREYVLITKQVADSTPDSSGKMVDWAEEQNATSTIDGQLVSFGYYSMEELHKKVRPPQQSVTPEKISNPVMRSVLVDRPLYMVFEIVTNLDFRLSWNTDTKELIYEQGKLNRVGTKHRCLFINGFADIETITNDFGSESLVYGEKLTGVPLMRDVSVYYILEGEDDKTRLRVEIHYHVVPILGWVIIPLLRYRMGKIVNKAINAIKEVCENMPELQYPGQAKVD